MYNRFGNQARGASKSIYSPGVSAILGGEAAVQKIIGPTSYSPIHNKINQAKSLGRAVLDVKPSSNNQFVTSNQLFYGK